MERFVLVEQHLREQQIRLTPQRRLVVRRAVATLHFTAEELVAKVQRVDKSIARGTVYRTLGLLHTAGILEKHDFRYGPPYYEVTYGKTHHDHLMCIRCGEIIEFQEPRWEPMQEEAAKRFGYTLLSHTHKLYGLCPACQRTPMKRLLKTHDPHLHVTEIVA